MKRFALLVGTAQLAAAFAGMSLMHLPMSVAAQGTPVVMKLGTATLNDQQHEWMKRFAAAVEKSSAGRIKSEVYPASQLGSIPRMIEGTQFGSIQAYVGPPEFLSGVDSRYEVLSAPGLFKDVGHAHRTLQDPEFNAAFLALGTNRGLKGIGLFVSGPAVFNTRTPVRMLADLEGRKVRVLASPMQMEQIRRLKATPVPMPLGEVLTALQQGALDGVMSVGSVLTALRYYDAAKYMVETNHAMVTVITVMNKAWFDRLPADLQKIVASSGQDVSRDMQQWVAEFVDKQRGVWKAGGGELSQLPGPEQTQLMKILQPVGIEITGKKADERALYELLVRAAKRNE